MRRDAAVLRRRILIAAVCALAALLPGATLAKGDPLAVSITGPGLPAPILVTDPLAMPAFGILGFMQVDTPIVPPGDLGLGYELQRDDFDRVRYYPDPHGSWGYVFYVGLINGSSGYDGHWYRASTVGDVTMRCVMEAHGVLLAGQRSNPSCATMLTQQGAPARTATSPDAPPTAAPPQIVTVVPAPAGVAQSAVSRSDGPDWTPWMTFGIGLLMGGVVVNRATVWKRAKS